MSNEMMKREMQEAVQAGERALQSLYAARDKLGSARNWGIFDMLGGGFISDFVKHSKMNDAAALMEQAKSDIQRFQRELRDVQVSLDLRMEIGSFLSFADFFLDGLVADYMVQSKIADAREQVDDAINRIRNVYVNNQYVLYTYIVSKQVMNSHRTQADTDPRFGLNGTNPHFSDAGIENCSDERE